MLTFRHWPLIILHPTSTSSSSSSSYSSSSHFLLFGAFGFGELVTFDVCEVRMTNNTDKIQAFLLPMMHLNLESYIILII